MLSQIRQRLRFRSFHAPLTGSYSPEHDSTCKEVYAHRQKSIFIHGRAEDPMSVDACGLQRAFFLPFDVLVSLSV